MDTLCLRRHLSLNILVEHPRQSIATHQSSAKRGFSSVSFRVFHVHDMSEMGIGILKGVFL